MQNEEKDLAKLLQNIQERLKRIEEELKRPRTEESAPNTIHFHVQEVNIQNLQLEELAYHLGRIDVKELSGMLNLGNTFSPKATPKKQSAEKKESPSSKGKPERPHVKAKNETSSSKKPVQSQENQLNQDIKIRINGKELNPNK